jgi:hypothetical protein
MGDIRCELNEIHHLQELNSTQKRHGVVLLNRDTGALRMLFNDLGFDGPSATGTPSSTSQLEVPANWKNWNLPQREANFLDLTNKSCISWPAAITYWAVVRARREWRRTTPKAALATIELRYSGNLWRRAWSNRTGVTLVFRELRRRRCQTTIRRSFRHVRGGKKAPREGGAS